MVTDGLRSKEGEWVSHSGAEKIRCDTCSRELKSSSEWVRACNGIMCEICYQNLLLPNMKLCFDD